MFQDRVVGRHLNTLRSATSVEEVQRFMDTLKLSWNRAVEQVDELEDVVTDHLPSIAYREHNTMAVV